MAIVKELGPLEIGTKIRYQTPRLTCVGSVVGYAFDGGLLIEPDDPYIRHKVVNGIFNPRTGEVKDAYIYCGYSKPRQSVLAEYMLLS